ncbi:MAG: inosine monophosphate cyclohydrolase [Candidatus Mcinerneyibacterium aminivorans]|jgi:hypothetical protein|uniref:Inosine monophosphate cyclohydrolase n=1 Tax=Candidatus Mcinerneyibacterium aminivorans TaxID=2703815 RepID=A0A5D0MIN8_9BACT|nr:MAG: inosine monophosphate cyclohydrolase [Candidatus Mcinerneyibacterium aminivorans]
MKNNFKKNIHYLQDSEYPGRGLIIGMTPDRNYAVQIYWIMGRSENSQNRIFVKDGKFLKNKIYNDSKKVDTSLTIYYSMKNISNIHIVSNGDQTETIYNYLKKKKSFEQAIYKRTFEPDKPNYTPRISGIINPSELNYKYKISIIKSFHNSSEMCIRNIYNYSAFIPGVGHCITTYKDNGNPLPSFEGEPYELPIYNDSMKTLNYYWDLLNNEYRVSIAAKYINLKSNKFEIKIINKNN